MQGLQGFAPSRRPRAAICGPSSRFGGNDRPAWPRPGASLRRPRHIFQWSPDSAPIPMRKWLAGRVSLASTVAGRAGGGGAEAGRRHCLASRDGACGAWPAAPLALTPSRLAAPGQTPARAAAPLGLRAAARSPPLRSTEHAATTPCRCTASHRPGPLQAEAGWPPCGWQARVRDTRPPRRTSQQPAAPPGVSLRLMACLCRGDVQRRQRRQRASHHHGCHCA